MTHRISATTAPISASMFHSISEVRVSVSNDIEKGDIYYVSGYGDAKRYALAKPALMRLMLAAGIEEISSKTSLLESRLWHGEWDGKFTQVDGTCVNLSGEKEIDLRVGGTRWTERYGVAMDNLLKKSALKDGTFQRVGRGVKCDGEWLKSEHLDLYRVELPEAVEAKFDRLARMAATRFVDQASKFGREKAQTGAILRALRAFFHIRTYTMKELEEDFIVMRSRIDRKAMREYLGEDQTKKIEAAMAIKALGLTGKEVAGLLSSPSGEDEMADIGRKILDPSSVTPDEAMNELFDTNEDPFTVSDVNDVVDASVVDASVADNGFSELASLERKIEIIKYAKELGYADAEGFTKWLFKDDAIKFGNIADGEAALIAYFLDHVKEWKADTPRSEVNKSREHLRDVVIKCRSEKRLPARSDECIQLEMSL